MAQDVKSTSLLPRALASGTEQFLSVTEGTRVFVMRLAREKPLGMAGGIIVVLMGLAALLADFIAPYPYAETTTLTRSPNQRQHTCSALITLAATS